MSDSLAQRLGWVLWPSFLVACVAELLLFSLFDPRDLQLFGQPVEVDRTLVYSLGFFAALGDRCSLERADGVPGALAVRSEPPHADGWRIARTSFRSARTLAEPAAPPLERSLTPRVARSGLNGLAG